jgi:hypothetical protein
MLSPSYLDTLPDALVSLWQTVEDDILQDVARRIAKMDTVTETAEWQLWRYEQSAAVRQDVTRTLAKYSKKSDKEIRRLLQQSGADSLAADDKIHKAAGANPQPVNDSPALLNLLNAGYEQTAGTWKNLTATTARTVSGEFEAACDRAWLQVSSGAFDYQTAVKRAVDGLAAGGIKGITYPSGHKDTLEVAVRRAVLTGVHQTTAKLQIARMDEVGCDFVEVTAHAGARPEHALWQGRQYHRGGAITYNGVRYPDFVSATHYGSGDGLCGWNCRHDFWPFWPGLSTPNHTDEELEALNAKTIEYNGEMYSEYEISQMQRAAERKVRAAKRTYLAEDAAGMDTTKAAAHLRTAREQLKHFCQDTGSALDSSRTSSAGFGRSAAGKATAGAVRYYKNWANVPGFDAPKTLAEYYQVKYNKPEEWARLRRDHDTLLSIDRKPWTPTFKKKAVETFREFKAAGVEISDHGVARFLSRSPGKKSPPFTIKDVAAQMSLPVNYVETDGKLVRYYNGLAVISSKENVLVSVVIKKRAKPEWRSMP